MTSIGVSADWLSPRRLSLPEGIFHSVREHRSRETDKYIMTTELTVPQEQKSPSSRPSYPSLLTTVLPLLFFGITTLQAANVAINEFVASNGEVLFDEDGDAEDWIELYNYGETAVSLKGFGLTDDLSRPFRWIFPDVDIGPGEYLLVWASGKDRTDPIGPLHANFSISSEGEPLRLSRPDGMVVDTVAATPLRRDLSYGRVPDGVGEWYFFEEPTPLAANTNTAYGELLDPPSFSPAGGFYSDSVDLEIHTNDPDATILFTLDGTEPHADNIGGTTYNYKNQYPEHPQNPFGPLLENSIETHSYDGPIRLHDRSSEPNRLSAISTTGTRVYDAGPAGPVFKGNVVRARVIKEGAVASEVVTHSYFIDPQGYQRYDLPVISVVAPEDDWFAYEHGIYVAGLHYDIWREEHPSSTLAVWRRPANYTQRGREWEIPGHIEFFSAGEGRYLSQNVGYRIHGNSSRNNPLKSLRVYARRSYDTDSRIYHRFYPDLFDIYGRPVDSFKRLIIHLTGGADHFLSRYRDIFLQTLLSPLGIDRQHYMPVYHFLNGEFWGHMNLIERIDRYYVASRYLIDPEDVAMLDLGHEFGIFQGVMLNEGTEEDLQDYLDLLDYVEAHDLADEEHFAYVADRVDIENCLLYHMGQIYIGNHDWPHNNNDFWRKRTPDRRPGAPPEHDGRWRWILVDLENGHGMWASAPDDDTLAWATRTESWGEDPARVSATILLRNLLQNDGFRRRFVNAFCDHINTTFQPSHSIALLDMFENWIGPVRDGEHRLRWPEFWGDHYQRTRDYATQRPGNVIQLLRHHYGFRFLDSVTFDVSDADHGRLRINTIEVDADTPGLPDPDEPYPFSGGYFRGHTIEVTALPRPGYRFAGWKEFPDHADRHIEVEVHSGLRLTALFASGAHPELLAYWNFNEPSQMLRPTYARVDAGLDFVPGPETGFTSGTGNGFDGANARGGDPGGRHLRINTPLGAELELDLPTNGHREPVLTFEVRRSNQGAAILDVDYSLDGNTWHAYAGIQVFAEEPLVHRLDFSGIAGVDDNDSLRIRFRFQRGEGGTEGNVRLDNLAVEAVPLPDASPPVERFEYWRWRHFDAGERADADLSGPEADRWAEGVSNLMRYALDIDPSMPAPVHGLPGLKFREGQVFFRFPMSEDKTDIAYIVERSEDAVIWTERLFDSRDAESLRPESGFLDLPVAYPADSVDLQFVRLIVIQSGM